MNKYLLRYGFFGFLKMLIDFLKTKLFFNKSRLIRFPFDIRNRKFIDLGTNLTTGVGCRFEAHPNNNQKKKCIVFGKNVEINDYVHIVSSESVKIGNNVLLASKIFISDTNHGCYSGTLNTHSYPETKPNDRLLSTNPVIIEDNVWIGEFVSILPGVRIGKGSIIGSNSVVSKSIPPNCIAVGSPARIIKKFNYDTQNWERIKK